MKKKKKSNNILLFGLIFIWFRESVIKINLCLDVISHRENRAEEIYQELVCQSFICEIKRKNLCSYKGCFFFFIGRYHQDNDQFLYWLETLLTFNPPTKKKEKRIPFSVISTETFILEV